MLWADTFKFSKNITISGCKMNRYWVHSLPSMLLKFGLRTLRLGARSNQDFKLKLWFKQQIISLVYRVSVCKPDDDGSLT